MAGSINHVTIVGHVAADPQVKQFPDNTKCNFSVATNRSYTRRDGTEVNQAEFHKVVTSGGLARVAERYVNKGKQVGIEGRLATRSYDDNMGNKRYITEIIAERLHLLGSAIAGQAATNIPRAERPETDAAGTMQDEGQQSATGFNANPNPPEGQEATNTPLAEDELPF